MKQLDGGAERALPFGTVDGIAVYGTAQLSTQLVRACIRADVPIGYYTEDGSYIGSACSRDHVDPARQKRQVLLTDDEAFCVEWSRRVVGAKIRNSLALLDSMHGEHVFSEGETGGLRHALDSLCYAESVDMAIGFEGSAARAYFQCLAKLVRNDAFAFNGRSTRPPKDPFNSMLSYGYSLLYRNIVGAIERHGLHPSFGFMHKIKRGHAALASDLIEDYRAPLVDRTVLELVNGGEVDASGFTPSEGGGLYMSREVMAKLTGRLSDILAERGRFLLVGGDGKRYGFQAMLDQKVNTAIEAIERHDATLYQPFVWESGEQ